MQKLSFLSSMKAWESAMHNKDRSKLDEILSKDFIWENLAMNGKNTKEETIQFTLNIRDEIPNFKIGNYKTIFESDEILVGTHSVHQDDREETLVLCIANITDDGKLLSRWRHLRAEYPK